MFIFSLLADFTKKEEPSITASSPKWMIAVYISDKFRLSPTPTPPAPVGPVWACRCFFCQRYKHTPGSGSGSEVGAVVLRAKLTAAYSWSCLASISTPHPVCVSTVKDETGTPKSQNGFLCAFFFPILFDEESHVPPAGPRSLIWEKGGGGAATGWTGFPGESLNKHLQRSGAQPE